MRHVRKFLIDVCDLSHGKLPSLRTHSCMSVCDYVSLRVCSLACSTIRWVASRSLRCVCVCVFLNKYVHSSHDNNAQLRMRIISSPISLWMGRIHKLRYSNCFSLQAPLTLRRELASCFHLCYRHAARHSLASPAGYMMIPYVSARVWPCSKDYLLCASLAL